jgi:hypothetical protein
MTVGPWTRRDLSATLCAAPPSNWFSLGGIGIAVLLLGTGLLPPRDPAIARRSR